MAMRPNSSRLHMDMKTRLPGSPSLIKNQLRQPCHSVTPPPVTRITP